MRVLVSREYPQAEVCRYRSSERGKSGTYTPRREENAGTHQPSHSALLQNQAAQPRPELEAAFQSVGETSGLKNLANDAASLPATRTTFLHNTNFSGAASAAASAIGAVAQLMVNHKARRDLEQSILASDANVTALIQLIGNDATAWYARQKNQLGVYGDQLSHDYETELTKNPDPILLLSFAKIIKSYRTQEAHLSEANPAPVIDKMKKAHEALVAYVKSNKNPKTFAELVTAVKGFVSAAQPLGQAIQALISAS